MKKLLFAVAVLWGGGLLGLWYYNETQTQRFAFRTVDVIRGDLLATISALGTLEPQEVVDVGAQIAGEILTFGRDPNDPGKAISFNSRVEQGTVLAQINDSLFRARVEQMRANLGIAEAEVLTAQARLKQTRRELERSTTLVRDRRVSATEHDTAVANNETAEATLLHNQSSVALARANLAEAEVNLSYTTIKSPVKGVILDRRVNIGQTVVSSLNAPSLFLIAKDLSRMEIWASVNEADIGAIHPGQKVRFTVASNSRDTFSGTVSQIRPNASMTQSVVTYTVAVDIDNTGGQFIPYLSAQLQFEVEQKDGVLLVPNAALRWRPKLPQVEPKFRQEYARNLQARASQAPEATRSLASRSATLWVRAGEFVRPVVAQVGLSDGLKTEIAVGGDLIAGSSIVVGTIAIDEGDESTTAAANGPKSPFLPDLKRNPTKR